MEKWLHSADIYVAKWGDDVNGDGSATAPFASINRATDFGQNGNRIMIGNGLWQESRGTSVNNYIFIGNTHTVFDALTDSWFALRSYDEAINCTFENYYQPRAAYYQTSSHTETVIFRNCKIRNTNLNTIWLECALLQFYGCDIYKLKVSRGTYANQKLHFIAENCTFHYWTTSYSGYGVHFLRCINNIFYYCNITRADQYATKYVGNVDVIKYNLAFNTTFGNAANNDLLNSEHLYFLDPKFNNYAIGNLTLQSNSPCPYRGRYNKTIGAYNLATHFSSNSPAISDGTLYNITKIDDIFVVNENAPDAYIETDWHDFQNQEILTRIMPHFFAVYDTNGNHIYLCRKIGLFYCNDISEQGTAVETFIHPQKQVSVDGNGYGNADDLYNSSEEILVSARYIKLKLYFN